MENVVEVHKSIVPDFYSEVLKQYLNKKITKMEFLDCMKAKYIETRQKEINSNRNFKEAIKEYKAKVNECYYAISELKRKKEIPAEIKEKKLNELEETLEHNLKKLSYFESELKSQEYWDKYFDIEKYNG